MSFLPSETAEAAPEFFGEVDLGQPVELQSDPNRHLDSRLQAALSDKALQRRLLRLYRDSRTLIDEQGVNTLYLALGFLHWRESPTVDRERRAPLLLLPVELNRSSVRERFTLKYSGEDLGANLSLEQKLKNDFGIALPSFPEEDLDPKRYFEAIASGSLVVGHGPRELVDLFGYDPVIAADLEQPAEQLHELLDGIEQHQPFVDRNLARLREVGTWDARVAELLQVLAERGYEVPRGE